MPLPPGTPTVTIGGIPAYELVADFREGYDLLGGPTARKGYLVNWYDRQTFAKGLLGLSNTTSVGGLISLQTPYPYPELSTMYATSIEIIPVGNPIQGTRQIAWPAAKVYANFACLPWSFSGIESPTDVYQNIDPATPLVWCEQTMTTSTEYMSIPTVGLVTAAGNLLQDTHWEMPIFRADLSITFLRMPYYPAQQLLTAGKSQLNSKTFLGIAPGYMMFIGSSQKQTRDTAGNFTRDVTLNFAYRNLQWDYTWDGKAGGFYQVKQTGGTPMIATSDLNSLIPTAYLI